ncbi:MAG: response regulator transcription factor [Bacteroidota bacterium]
MNKTTIYIIDDHKLLREVLSFLLNRQPGFEVTGATDNIAEALNAIRFTNPSIVLLDINMPQESGFRVAEKILKIAPDTRIIAMSMYALPVYAKRMFKLGAWGYLTKNSPHEEMIFGINKVAANERFVCDEIRNMIASDALDGENVQPGISSLTEREIEILTYLKRGLSSKEIGIELELSGKTVEVHRYNILRKLNLKNVASLVSYAHEMGL